MAQSFLGSMIIIVAGIAGALLILWLLQHFWTPSARRAHNDVIGPSVSVIGTKPGSEALGGDGVA